LKALFLLGNHGANKYKSTALHWFAKTDLYSGRDVVNDLYSAAVWVSRQRLRNTIDIHVALWLGAGLLSINCLT